jgi:hypothetical protein
MTWGPFSQDAFKHRIEFVSLLGIGAELLHHRNSDREIFGGIFPIDRSFRNGRAQTQILGMGL